MAVEQKIKQMTIQFYKVYQGIQLWILKLLLGLFLLEKMIRVVSPFIQDIPKCKISMRKLRKKIYKYTSVQQKSKKIRDCTQDIFTILQTRAVPDFVLQSLKKKRTLDLASLKNILIIPGSSFTEMSSMVRSQEEQIRRIFDEHRCRLKRQKRAPPKLDHRQTNCSSTDFSIKNEGISLEPSENSENIQSREESSQNHFSHQMMMEAHGDQADYLALESSLFSQEQLFRF